MIPLRRKGNNLLTGNGLSVEVTGRESDSFMDWLLEQYQPAPLLDYDVATHKERQILECLGDRNGNWVHLDTIMHHLYWDDPNGGPADTRIIDVFICKLRKKLVSTDYEIQTAHGGWRRLVPVGTTRKTKEVKEHAQNVD